MSFRSLFKSLQPRSVRAVDRRARRERARRRPVTGRLSVESLEDRCLLASFTFIDLGTLGRDTSTAYDINASGQVVGSAGYLASGQEHAFIWSNGTMTDLGTLGGQGGWDSSEAVAINDRGQVVGRALTASNVWHAFLVTPEDTDGNGTPDLWYRDTNADAINDLMRDLGTLPGMQWSAASDINEVGQVVGWSRTDTVPTRAFLWQDGVMTDLGTLGGLQTVASAINDAGQVVGNGLFQNTGTEHAFLWQNGVMTDLGSGFATDINASGQVVVGDYYSQGALWTPTTPNATVGTFTDLPPLADVPDDPDHFSHARGINTAAQVVGTSTYYVDGGEDGGTQILDRAVIWRDGVAHDLTWEAFEDGWSSRLTSATAINDAGQIVGQTYDRHAYLLTPIIEGVPHLTISNVTVAEGNTGTAVATFIVALSPAVAEPVTVDWATADGTATGGSDYQSASGTITFAPGETQKTIDIAVYGDELYEPSETFTVNLTSPSGTLIADPQATGVIQNDDQIPFVNISDAWITEGNSGTQVMNFTVSLTRTSSEGVWVNYTTVNGNAKATTDYLANSGPLYFAPGETSKSIEIVIKGDKQKEQDEYFYVNLSGAIGGTLSDSQATGTILNDDGGRAGGKQTSSAAAVDAAIDDWMTIGRKKRR